MSTRLILVRHAEAEGNFKRVFHGFTDGDITQKGHLQAKLAAEKLNQRKIDILYASSLKRTKQTARYIAENQNLKIIEDKRLREINGGDWEGKPWDELPLKWPKEYDTWENSPHNHQMPNGESMTMFYERILAVVTEIISTNEGKNICIVTHGTAIRALMCYFYNYPLNKMIFIKWFENTAITEVDFDDSIIKIVAEGDDSHLGDEFATVKNQDWWGDYLLKFKNIKDLEVE